MQPERYRNGEERYRKPVMRDGQEALASGMLGDAAVKGDGERGIDNGEPEGVGRSA